MKFLLYSLAKHRIRRCVMQRVDSSSLITHVDLGCTDYHAILRSGRYGCIYDNFFEAKRDGGGKAN